MPQLRDEVDRLIKNYCSAVLQKDPQAFLSQYRSDVRVFDTWTNWSCEGIDAFKAPITEWLTTLDPNEKVMVNFDEVKLAEAGSGGCMTAFVTYTATDLSDKKLRSMTNRMTWVLAPDSTGKLHIVHEHTSVPLDGATMRGMLSRPVPPT